MRCAPRFAWLLLPLGGCFSDCGGGDPPDPELNCVDDQAAPSQSHAVVLGSAEDGEPFAPLAAGAKLQLDYGPQGGQHFYYSVRLYGASRAHTLVVSFQPKDSAPAGQGGAPLDGPPLPSAFVALTEFDVDDAGCENAWLEIDNLLLEVNSDRASGTLRVELGTCDGACNVNDAGVYVHSQVDASHEIELSYVP